MKNKINETIDLKKKEFVSRIKQIRDKFEDNIKFFKEFEKTFHDSLNLNNILNCSSKNDPIFFLSEISYSNKENKKYEKKNIYESNCGNFTSIELKNKLKQSKKNFFFQQINNLEFSDFRTLFSKNCSE